MRTEWKVFAVVAAFLLGVSVVYAVWTNRYPSGLDWVGGVSLFLAGLLCAMCAGFFWFVSRRIDLRPEDRPDAEISEGAGEVGFFSPGSYWPFGLALSVTIAGLGLVFWQMWLLGAGLLAVAATTSGLLFEYYAGTRRTAEH